MLTAPWVRLEPTARTGPTERPEPLVLTDAVGATGATGADGAVGPQGPAGATGATGAAGAVGATGATGATGPESWTAGSGRGYGSHRCHRSCGPTGATGPTAPTEQPAQPEREPTEPTEPMEPRVPLAPRDQRDQRSDWGHGCHCTNGTNGATGATGPTGPNFIYGQRWSVRVLLLRLLDHRCADGGTTTSAQFVGVGETSATEANASQVLDTTISGSSTFYVSLNGVTGFGSGRTVTVLLRVNGATVAGRTSTIHRGRYVARDDRAPEHHAQLPGRRQVRWSAAASAVR